MGISTFPAATASGGASGIQALGGSVTRSGTGTSGDYITWDFGNSSPFSAGAYTISFANIAGIVGLNNNVYKVALLNSSNTSVATASGTSGGTATSAAFSITISPAASWSKIAVSGAPGGIIYAGSSVTCVTVESGAKDASATNLATWSLKAALPTPSMGGHTNWQHCMTTYESNYNNGFISDNSNRLYTGWVLGAYTQTATTGSTTPFYRWNPTTNTWTELAGTPWNNPYQNGNNAQRLWGHSYTTWSYDNDYNAIVAFRAGCWSGSAWNTYWGGPSIYYIDSNSWGTGPNTWSQVGADPMNPVKAGSFHYFSGSGSGYGTTNGQPFWRFSVGANGFYSFTSNGTSFGVTNYPGWIWGDNVNGYLHMIYKSTATNWAYAWWNNSTWNTMANGSSTAAFGNWGVNFSEMNAYPSNASYDEARKQIWVNAQTTSNLTGSIGSPVINVLTNTDQIAYPNSNYSWTNATLTKRIGTPFGWNRPYTKFFFGTGALSTKVWSTYFTQIAEVDQTLPTYPSYLT